MIERWEDLGEWERRETVAPAAAYFGISRDEAVQLVSRAITRARHTALESASDIDIPEDMRLLAIVTEAVTGQHITAIKRSPAERDVTSYPAHWEAADRVVYHIRRLQGLSIQSDPARRTQRFTAYYFIVNGNPIIVERYLRQAGFHEASAGSPTACLVCDTEAVDRPKDDQC